jgi:hypothetical protein
LNKKKNEIQESRLALQDTARDSTPCPFPWMKEDNNVERLFPAGRIEFYRIISDGLDTMTG